MSDTTDTVLSVLTAVTLAACCVGAFVCSYRRHRRGMKQSRSEPDIESLASDPVVFSETR